jgi:hypothetical protein
MWSRLTSDLNSRISVSIASTLLADAKNRRKMTQMSQSAAPQNTTGIRRLIKSAARDI